MLQPLSLAGLLLALFGVTMATWQEPTFCATTLALGLAVNAMLSLRNVSSKHIMKARWVVRRLCSAVWEGTRQRHAT